jgi:multidrug efflux system membrane fusion protein
LFAIDPRPYQAALDAANANAARAEAQLAQAKSDLLRGQVQEKSAQTEFGRNKTLLDRGMVTKAEYDQTVVGVESSRAMVAANQAAVRSGEEGARAAQAAIETAKLDLEHCIIRAPLAGRTGSLLVHQGSIIKANDTGPMLVITQTKPIYVSFTLAERYLDDVRARHAEGKVEVRAAAPGQDEKTVKGELTFIDNIVDRQTSTIRLKAVFANEKEELWPGQYVKATIVLGEVKDAVVVPAQAVQTSQKGIFVYVVGPDKKAELRHVKTGVTYRDLIVVAEGLKPDETVVSEGHLRVAPGGPLNILDGTPGEGERPREPQSAEPAKP